MMIAETALSRPGRPKDSAKREEIIAAATELFMDNGFDQTSMEAVARKAGVSKLTIYSHFADKNELFRAIAHYRCDKLGMPTSFTAEAQLSPLEALTGIAQRMAEKIFRVDSLRLMRMLQAEVTRHPEIVQAYYEVGPSRIKAAFAELMRSFNEQGKLSIPDPMRAAEQFFSLLKGERLQRVLLMLNTTPNEEEMQTHVKATVDFFLKAYRPSTK